MKRVSWVKEQRLEVLQWRLLKRKNNNLHSLYHTYHQIQMDNQSDCGNPKWKSGGGMKLSGSCTLTSKRGGERPLSCSELVTAAAVVEYEADNDDDV